MKTESYQLGELEELVLMIVAILQEEAYGVKVMDEILDQVGRKVNISAVHTVLDRLEKRTLCLPIWAGQVLSEVADGSGYLRLLPWVPKPSLMYIKLEMVSTIRYQKQF